jgi:hypothetical protein
MALGPELVVNGGFDTDTDWTTNGFVIAGGVATAVLVSGYARMDAISFSVTIGKIYRLSAKITNTSSSFVKIGGSVPAGEFYGNQDIDQYIEAIVPGTTLFILTDDPTTGTVIIDNVSVKEFIADEGGIMSDLGEEIWSW